MIESYSIDIYIHTGCSLNIAFFPRILESLPPLPRQHSTVIRLLLVVQKLPANRSDCTLALCLKVSYSDVGEGGVAVNFEKTQFFLNTL